MLLLVDNVVVGLRKASQLGQLMTFILGRDTGVEDDDCHAPNLLQ
jgi:hypothetical protein